MQKPIVWHYHVRYQHKQRSPPRLVFHGDAIVATVLVASIYFNHILVVMIIRCGCSTFTLLRCALQKRATDVVEEEEKVLNATNTLFFHSSHHGYPVQAISVQVIKSLCFISNCFELRIRHFSNQLLLIVSVILTS